MSLKEIDIITPATSDLSHDETSNPLNSSISQQQKMSNHNPSTPISSPSSDPAIIPTSKPADTIGAIPLSPSATSEHESHIKETLDNSKDSDEEDDDLFNEPENDHPAPINTTQSSSSLLPPPVSTSSNTTSATTAADSTVTNDVHVASSPTTTTSIKVEEPSVEKRAADSLEHLPPAKRAKPDTTKIKRESIDASNAFPVQSSSDLTLDPRDPPVGSPRVLPKHQVKFALASLRSVKRLKDAAPFLEPVNDVALNIPTYYTIITRPMDLGTMEKHVNEGKYGSVSELISDMDLIVANCVQFNGTDSFISNMARNIKASFDKHMNNMPPYELPAANSNSKAKKRSHPAGNKTQRAVATATPPPASKEPSAPAKKVAKTPSTRESTAVAKTTTPVRSTKSASTASKNFGKKASPGVDSQPFALHPSGVPTIRRESSAGGRPKREIHPPKSKDLPYGDLKPRKKKFAAGLRFSGVVLKELVSKKYEHFNFPFLQPVDPVALNCPSYFNIIKEPMDLGTIQHKYSTNQYETAEDFEHDVRLVISNCYKFNPEGSPVNKMGHQLEDMFNRKWKDLPLPPLSPPPVIVESESEEESDVSDNELIKDDPAIKFLEQQLERMQKDLDKMKKEALQKAREARDLRRKSKKSKKPNGTVGYVKKPGRAGSNAEASTMGRRKSAGRRPSSANGRVSPGAPAPYVTYEMKEELSRMCQNLPEKKMRHVLKLIQEAMPNFNSDDQEEVELEIDQLNPATVLKLYDYVVKSNNKRPRTYSTNAKQTVAKSAQIAQKRKGKPLSEAEQTRQIEELQRKLEQFDKIETGDTVGLPADQNVHDHDMMISASGVGMASAGNAGHSINDSSDDDDDSSSSEEE